jgi:carbon monoxide dehydrogenase subunit G
MKKDDSQINLTLFEMTNLNLEFQTTKSADCVFEHLSDMQKFCSIHPVIYKIEALTENEYKIYERLKFIFVPVSFTYTAVVTTSKENRGVKMKANVKGMATVEMNFQIRDGVSGAVVDEQIVFRSSLPVKAIMKKVFRKQHEQLFRNIELVL